MMHVGEGGVHYDVAYPYYYIMYIVKRGAQNIYSHIIVTRLGIYFFRNIIFWRETSEQL